jgi:hypothetical protein
MVARSSKTHFLAEDIWDSPEDGNGPPTIYGVGDTFRPALFPGLAIEVAGLWP